MVDYSKWDRFAEDLSDEDDCDSHQPAVHEVPKGSQVRIGPSGAEIVQSKQTEVATVVSSAALRNISGNTPLSDTPDIGPPVEGFYYCPTHRWKQDKSEVTLLISVPVLTKASDVSVNLKGDTTSRLTITVRGAVTLEKNLKFKVSDISSDTPDWELVNNSASDRVILITLKKHQYIPSSVFWWSCVFVGDEEIDVSTIPGRARSSLNRVSSVTTSPPSTGAVVTEGTTKESSTLTFAESWKVANEMFREKVSQRRSAELAPPDSSETLSSEILQDNGDDYKTIRNL